MTHGLLPDTTSTCMTERANIADKPCSHEEHCKCCMAAAVPRLCCWDASGASIQLKFWLAWKASGAGKHCAVMLRSEADKTEDAQENVANDAMLSDVGDGDAAAMMAQASASSAAGARIVSTFS